MLDRMAKARGSKRRSGEKPFSNPEVEKAFEESFKRNEEALRRLAKL